MKEIIKKLNTDKTKFTIDGVTNFKNEPRVFEVNVYAYNDGVQLLSIRESGHVLGDSMGVSKFGPTCVWLFTYDLFYQKTTYKINYKDIKFIEE